MLPRRCWDYGEAVARDERLNVMLMPMVQSRAGLRVVQLSDCHLLADPARSYRGIDPWANLQEVWQAARAWKPDIVLLTGDLREENSALPYEQIAGLLGNGIPILALPGNHDDPSVMNKWFPRGPWDGLFSHETGQWQLVLLDSTAPGRVEGALRSQTIQALRQAVSVTRAAHVLIALHHQPVPVDSPWIDRWPLQDPEPFLELVDSEARIRCVVWGHIHQCFEAMRGETLLLGCPSTAANTVRGSRRFLHDGKGPGCRWLRLDPSGAIETGVISAAV